MANVTRTTKIALPGEFTISTGGKNYTVTTTEWTEDTILAAVEQGLKIKLDRAGAGKSGADVDEARKATAEALCDGTWKRSGGGGRVVDPILREAYNVADNAIAEGLVKQGAKRSQAGFAKLVREKREAAWASEHPAVAKWLEEGKRRVAALQKITDVDEHLGDLLG